ncbi:hypothetical protein L3X38_003494 [Prunus dulcis]|uniref:Uncharacterized protein n=1 Tax=Prunus dulcis TaxID=3755 RepID=A0AAD4ZM69_PRUDU|nr:hypothetical protein L3X38_003494 [Prunus dulcis]
MWDSPPTETGMGIPRDLLNGDGFGDGAGNGERGWGCHREFGGEAGVAALGVVSETGAEVDGVGFGHVYQRRGVDGDCGGVHYGAKGVAAVTAVVEDGVEGGFWVLQATLGSSTNVHTWGFERECHGKKGEVTTTVVEPIGLIKF